MMSPTFRKLVINIPAIIHADTLAFLYDIAFFLVRRMTTGQKPVFCKACDVNVISHHQMTCSNKLENSLWTYWDVEFGLEYHLEFETGPVIWQITPSSTEHTVRRSWFSYSMTVTNPNHCFNRYAYLQNISITVLMM